MPTEFRRRIDGLTSVWGMREIETDDGPIVRWVVIAVVDLYKSACDEECPGNACRYNGCVMKRQQYMER